MKKLVVIWISCFALILSGCALFPLKKDEQALLRNDEGEATLGLVEEIAETSAPEEETKPAGQVVKPAAIEDGEGATGNLIYCISPVNVREGHSGTRVIGSLRTGDAVAKLGQEGGWIEIEFEGMRGFVYQDFMSENP
jgi:Bacterial SH3 domain.